MLTLREQGVIHDARLTKNNTTKNVFNRIFIRRRPEYKGEIVPIETETIEMELEPCPFCGTMPLCDYYGESANIYCPECGCCFVHSLSLEESQNRWNTRSTQSHA